MGDGSVAELAARHGSDKLAHGYCPAYDTHFAPIRHRVTRVLEIGVGGYDDPHAGGASLLVWRDYFPGAHIVGLEFYPKELALGDRVTIARGTQARTDGLVDLSERYGPFDVVIDDGSHINWHRNTSFATLFPLLADGGVYVLEDLHTSYLTEMYGGGWPQDPNADDIHRATTELLKSLIDAVNHQYIPNRAAGPFDRMITGLSVYPKIAFVTKGTNEITLLPVDHQAVLAETRPA